MEEVQEIDQEAFSTQWPPPSYKRELQNRLAKFVVARWNKGSLASTETGTNPTTRQGRLDTLEAERPLFDLERIVSRVRHFFSPEQPASQRKPKEILGFAGLWFMADEAHLTTIGVREEHRRRGIGELLLISCIELAIEKGASVASLEVRMSNLGAQALYEKYGFNKVGVRPRYYTDNGEDALIMTTDLITSASYQSMFQRRKQEYLEKREEAILPPQKGD